MVNVMSSDINRNNGNAWLKITSTVEWQWSSLAKPGFGSGEPGLKKLSRNNSPRKTENSTINYDVCLQFCQ